MLPTTFEVKLTPKQYRMLHAALSLRVDACGENNEVSEMLEWQKLRLAVEQIKRKVPSAQKTKRKASKG